MTNDTKTVEDFNALGLAAPLLQAIADTGYTKPTPIQAQAIPIALTGIDLMAGAQTGTGKTAAFTLPILNNLLPMANTSTSPAKHPVRALILAPTRELAIQVEENIKTYAKNTNLRSLCVFGGVDIRKQTPALKTGIEVLVATPGRLLDHVEQKTLQLNQVRFLVLDEADRMLDMGFMPDLKRILALLPKKRQTLMFSATFSKEIKKLSDEFLNNPALIEVARSNATNDNVQQKAYAVSQRDKETLLAQLLKEDVDKQVIVFTKTKLTANRLSRALVRDGIAADAIHGDKTQKERIAALDAFKEKVLQGEDAVQEDLLFHLAIAKASGNSTMNTFMLSITPEIITNFEKYHVCDEDQAQKGIQEHTEIYNAIVDQDPQLAKEMMKVHFKILYQYCYNV